MLNNPEFDGNRIESRDPLEEIDQEEMNEGDRGDGGPRFDIPDIEDVRIEDIAIKPMPNAGPTGSTLA